MQVTVTIDSDTDELIALRRLKKLLKITRADDLPLTVTRDVSGIDTYYSVQEVAGALGVDDETIRRLIKRKEITVVKVGGSYRISEGKLLDYLGRNTTLRNEAEATHKRRLEKLRRKR